MLEDELPNNGLVARERRAIFNRAMAISAFLIMLPAIDGLIGHALRSEPLKQSDRPKSIVVPVDTYQVPEVPQPATFVAKVPLPLPKVNNRHKQFEPVIQKVARRYAVDPMLINAIIMAESSFNPQAVSNRGARGLMQLMPETARSLGVEDSFNPEHNIDGGVRYFKRLMRRFDGDTQLALAAYNAGSTKVRRYNGVPPYKATRTYIRKVLAYYQVYKSVSDSRLRNDRA